MSDLETRSFTAGDVLFAEGSEGDEAYLILDGFVTVTRDQDGNEVALGTRAEGEIIGEMALIEKTTRSATVIAGDAVNVQVITSAALEELLSGSPDILTTILNQLLESLRNANDLIGMYASRP